ncbi:PAS domain-containing sensor histidine kinase [Roseospira navarrensis]|uniref:GHKL domain-containing protein n=1 Tax=Roseospira navarrensis TaxID=140058 RepID=A0A7X1ZDD0_9PROT|nr:PAS domain-containing sensor histidine kinase [Roseospira navarrensis]MQX35145.1 GHKL domain-containing protein [Roseospira navarrensis]
MADDPTTHFASSVRLDREALGRQARKVAGADYPAAILDGVSVPVFVLNEQRQIVFANTAFQQFVPDDDPARFIGRRAGEAVRCVHADNDLAPGGCGTAEACRNCEAIQAVLQAHAKGRDERTFQLVLQGGEAVNAIIRATRIEVEGETFIIVALVDIKDTLWRRDVERAFLHDVMNIAGSIRSSSEALSLFDAATQQDYMSRIVTACDTLISEIHSHRLMISAEDGDLEPTFVPLDSLVVLERMISIVSQHTAGEGRSVVLAPSARSVVFRSDEGLLSRVILNLLKNALEASDPSQTVTADTGQDGGTVWFSVHNAAHMPPKIAARVFRRFFSTKGASRGIGTYSARLLTEKYLRGTIAFTSDPESGTTFTVRYPQDAAAHTARP